MSDYHVPVMLQECVEGLAIKPDGIYVDVTFGGGGHSKEILKHLGDNGHLFGFDQDVDAKQNALAIENRSFTFVQANFRHLKRYLKLHGVKQVDGVLGDLGISSYQIDAVERGFSIRGDAELDMRMDKNAKLTAKNVVNEYSEEQLHKILGMYGEIKNAKTLASAIVSQRFGGAISTTGELMEVLKGYAPRNRENKYFAQVFQAIRIEVNDEMGALEDFLEQSAEVIKPGGRLVIESYHSLEDRMVKNFINKGKVFGEVEKDFFGNELKPFKAVNRKPIVADQQELTRNSRSRSAKLRVAVRL
ncbi:16S rRNA (cytosine(1402)-N(4))-methyltransferase RsmH [Roseivirga pacifica]|uniref:16S rRNA (cytosine(1402)-N(4))-methyltransferase RsmH n=1 Tax=Roseivirga pacifica TaxID=1267423 RepID=UPI00209558F4|nr:16S rRNA (cytosine(1402)-N(4))-methyltransferase RsmH [Roseivirga pacifica]MCO6358257.1 16S rRNA (cytosine(1402)-N(4))-methyltransferase RsmH [Roseivirga pacifica]MCO6366279.1 16S rRNA (cytosine(1402)-N(4))-methyltransferase RsmH [Roseivirga pacifica]MCO6369170.1 16S rRNA (cytosine(1402)-N(4))-methyltransferase RsmH [Roseivirga pacifica]MCO6373988.1 16S rRNA (cytosine(1402)-N(4))-methyltransferase RsmH [Roseivirga pacifica]MCO6378364.1 16S rRNA (cytosine(1402)-N(4))-methyltransferase RsmH [